jgi:uncharacterized integral membrane protein (TIGR00698 family)
MLIDLRSRAGVLLPGVLVCGLVAMAAAFLADNYGAPTMLFALLLGMALHFLSGEARTAAGIEFSARALLRWGVALLGLGIGLGEVIAMGNAKILLLVTVVLLTMGFGLLAARLAGQGRHFGLLTGGAVAICGASAALAIASVLPRQPKLDQQMIFTVLAVTALSTVAMILYPIIALRLGLSAQDAGLFLGATIHDVAQVVGAGYAISPEAGDVAAVTKLFRVALLIPVFLALSLWFGQRGARADGAAVPRPWFIGGFVLCVLLGSSGWLPAAVTAAGLAVSRACLVMAIAALGMKTTLATLVRGGAGPMLLVLAETLFLALLVLGWIGWSGGLGPAT